MCQYNHRSFCQEGEAGLRQLPEAGLLLLRSLRAHAGGRCSCRAQRIAQHQSADLLQAAMDQGLDLHQALLSR
jgi:hypothetical protein